MGKSKIRRNPGKRSQQRRFDITKLRRRPDALKIIIREFIAVDCMACNKCCKDLTDTVILEEEPDRDKILALLDSRGLLRQINYSPGEFRLPSRDRMCVLFDEEQELCSIYPTHPRFCGVYPFSIGSEVMRSSRGTPLFFLSHECPPCASVYGQGISFISSDDITIPIKDILRNPELFFDSEIFQRNRRGFEEHLERGDTHFSIPLLERSFRCVMDAYERGEPWITYSEPPFISDGETIYFSIN